MLSSENNLLFLLNFYYLYLLSIIFTHFLSILLIDSKLAYLQFYDVACAACVHLSDAPSMDINSGNIGTHGAHGYTAWDFNLFFPENNSPTADLFEVEQQS